MTTSSSNIKVRYAETDRMGVVYYANYLIWFEVARTEFLSKRGVSYREIEDRDGLYLMVVETRCRHKAPATYDDDILVTTWVSKIKNTSLTFEYKVLRDNTVLAEGMTSHVFTTKNGKPARIPPKVRAAII